MSPTLELLSTALDVRADALGVALLALAGWGQCRRYARRHDAGQDFSRFAGLLIAGAVLAGALAAEWAGAATDHSGPTGLASLLLARGAALGGAALLVAVMLRAEVREALLRARLRSHADTERLLQQAKTAADEASRAKGDFLAVMSHEIRTPLNAVMGFANLLYETPLDDIQRGYIATITSEGARLGALINDILDLTKIEEGRLVLERLPFAPVETTQEVLRLLSARALEKGVDLRFEAQITGPLLLAGDPLRFRQVLVNLVDNAIKFTPRGAVTLFLRWTPPAPGTAHGRLSVRVRDTGIGIAEEKQQDLFKMFMQADTSTTRRYGGTGLGLAICQRLVMLMGGEITVWSRRGEGSVFYFSLPLAPAALSPSAPAEPEPALRPNYSPRILVVDDMETNRFLLEVFLRRNGFIPELAAGGEEAIRLAAKNRYDAILMDLQMPDLDGYTAARRIRAAEPPGRRTPIVALTASIARGTRDKCLAAGMDEHMTKPLDLKKFKAVLSTLLAAQPAHPASAGSTVALNS